MLYHDVQGDGPTVVLLHGWGLNRQVWSSVAAVLAKRHRVLSIDLPGHGRSPSINPYTLQTVADAVADVITNDSVIYSYDAAVIGWSLGGLVAMQLAITHPKKVNKLITLACSAQFVATADWPYGVTSDVLSKFSEDLQKDHRATVLRFLAIQSLGSEHARKEIKALKPLLFSDGEPDTEALLAGLQILQSSKLQAQLGYINCPSLVMVGKRDGLVNPEACYQTAKAISRCETYTLPDAGHAPFISHPQEFQHRLERFLCEQIEL